MLVTTQTFISKQISMDRDGQRMVYTFSLIDKRNNKVPDSKDVYLLNVNSPTINTIYLVYSNNNPVSNLYHYSLVVTGQQHYIY